MEYQVSIIECPRDAMQGIKDFIPSRLKADYLIELLKVGFHTLDFGSFVSPKAIPQMKDTADVLEMLSDQNSDTALLAIIANERGAEMALGFDKIDYLGFPLSLSEIFQKRNTNKTIAEALKIIEKVHLRCIEKKLVVYLSMGFGNPYGEAYDSDTVGLAVEKLSKIGISKVALSDTIGVARAEQIYEVLKVQMARFKNIDFGIHLHSRPGEEEDKINAALEAGCRRFDGALLGYGGCPMAKDELMGNIRTETLVQVVEKKGFRTGINQEALENAMRMARKVFQS